MDLNRHIMIGRLGSDPKIREVNDLKIATFSIATSQTTIKQGEKIEETTWNNVVAFGKKAELCEKYLKKGSKVYVAGELSTSKYRKEGEEEDSSYTKTKIERIIMLDSKPKEASEPIGVPF